VNTPNPTKSPDDEVTARICQALAEASLLPAESVAKLRTLLLAGTMTPEEWKFLLEAVE
jgi:hypothetical protein